MTLLKTRKREREKIMIYVTGDVHCPIDVKKLNRLNFPVQRLLTKDDYLIVTGDFGIVWDDSNSDIYWRKWFNTRNYTTLFVDGNHENHDILATFPVVERFGSKVRQIEETVFQLMRGETYTIDGKTFFTMGGASSTDKRNRIEGKSWWEAELPSDQEYENGLTNLDKINREVDFIITHCAPDSIIYLIADWYKKDKLTNFLEIVKQTTKYKKWFFGHYHIDRIIEDKHYCLYDSIIELGE